jgi:hypothetical protein
VLRIEPQVVKAFLEWVNLLAAGGAAAFWLWSALIHVPDILETSLSGPDSLTSIIRRQARLSAVAAFCAAVSIVAQLAVKWAF